jgi:phosphoribosylaminoimidazolecarboxamide formyltransferase/IMP cyclohydrolase
MTENLRKIRRALLSVSNKTGLVEFAQSLNALGVDLLSTGGTARLLRDAGLPVRDVADLTKFPEMMDGRVKTLHPNVHGGLLALRDNAEHVEALNKHSIEEIDLLAVNLYPFEATVAAGADYDTAIENIDIGGPAMIRAAAKNHGFVAVAVDPSDYDQITQEMSANGGATTYATRQKLAQQAYARTAAYDAAVSTWMASAAPIKTPKTVAFAGTLAQVLRYGENPHQGAAFYTDGSHSPGVATARQLQGKALSYNNINDTDAAFSMVSELDRATPACAIIKHANPCGVSAGKDLASAYQAAFDCDRTSAFGGIVAFNQTLDADTAKLVLQIFTEVVIAPDATDAAIALFAEKKNLRLLLTGALSESAVKGKAWRQVTGGILVQDQDNGMIDANDLQIVTKRSPTAAELDDLLFAWKVAKHVKSNAIVYAKNQSTVGIGAGQMSRIDSTRIAARKSGDMATEMGQDQKTTVGSVVASDAFFPFADGLLAAAEAGATAIIQPGGAMRDDDVIKAADEAGLAMVFTGMRHFRH